MGWSMQQYPLFSYHYKVGVASYIVDFLTWVGLQSSELPKKDYMRFFVAEKLFM